MRDRARETGPALEADISSESVGRKGAGGSFVAIIARDKDTLTFQPGGHCMGFMLSWFFIITYLLVLPVLSAGEYRMEVRAEDYETKMETVTHEEEPTEQGMAPERPGSQIGETFLDCPACPLMVVVPAGSFIMGSPSSEADRSDNEGPVHEVRIAEPFAVGVHEVTRGEYGQFVATTGYAGGDSCWTYERDREEKRSWRSWLFLEFLFDDLLFGLTGQGGSEKNRSGRSWREPGFGQTDEEPVVCVNWSDARAYAAWLSEETGQAYRLPSEAEWEYVARAGTQTARYWGEGESEQCEYANGADISAHHRSGCMDGYAQTALVGIHKANGFGLYDVLGNVFEWVQDCWNADYRGAPETGQAWEEGDCSGRVLRGGSWGSGPGDLRSAYRTSLPADIRVSGLGFRIARSLP